MGGWRMGNKAFKYINKFFPYLVLIIITYFLTFKVNVPDFDLWARLAVGSLFFQTGGVLKHDIFAYSNTKPLWIDHEWGSGVILFAINHVLGEWGFFALKALLIAAIFILIIRTYKLNKEKILNIEPLYLILIGYSVYPSIASSIRSQLFTFLFFTLWIYLLERVRRGENRLIWIFPVTMLFWANMHGGFVVGLGLASIYAIGELLNKRNPLPFFGILVLSELVTLINPYGINYWQYIVEATTMTRVGFTEWQQISLKGPFHDIFSIQLHILLGFFIFALMTFMVFIKSVIKKAKPDWVKILLVIVIFYFSFKHQRHTTFFVLAVSGLFYQHYADLLSSIAELIRNKLHKYIYISLVIVKNIVVYTSIIYLTVTIFPTLQTKLITHPSVYPIGSFEFIKQNNLSGNLGTTYNWGSYALWKLFPQCHVLIDGRYEEVYPNDMYIKALIYSEHLNESWPRFLDIFHTDIIVAPKNVYRKEDFNRLTDWQIVYTDMVSMVLLPKNKIKDTYIYPNFNNTVYWYEDLSKHVNLK